MDFNVKCKLCGSDGYQGLIDFECSNSKCSLFKSTKTESVDYDKVISINHLPAIQPMPLPASLIYNASMSQCGHIWDPNAKTFRQQKFALAFIGELFDGNLISDGIIAGGAPRDWWCDVMARDIDLFVKGFDVTTFKKRYPHTSITPASKKALKTSRTNGFINAQHIYGNTSNYLSDFEVWGVPMNGETFQIVNVIGASLAAHVMTFDFGINMIYCVASKGPHTWDRLETFPSIEFETDIRNKTLSIYPSMMNPKQLTNLTERYKKMQAKFPGFRLEMRF